MQNHGTTQWPLPLMLKSEETSLPCSADVKHSSPNSSNKCNRLNEKGTINFTERAQLY